jgi:hydrogenase maturation protease
MSPSLPAWPLPVRIVGVGSPLGDDALAWQVIHNLQGKLEGKEGLEFHRLEGGQRLLDILDGRGSLVLVDALEPGRQPGAIHRLAWPDQRLEALRPGSTHQLRPAEALRLAAALGTLPGCVVIFAVEARHLDPQAELSSAVRAALRKLVELIYAELTTP